MLHASPSYLVALVFVAQEPDSLFTALWVVGAFVALVGVFVVYQKGQSGWTWREFGDGMLVLLVKGLVLGASTIAGHPHTPNND